MINICYLVSSLSDVGPTRQLLYILKHLDRNKYNPTIITLFSDSKNVKKKWFIDLGLIIKSVNGSKSPFLIFKIIKYLLYNKNNFDIVHSQGFLADIMNAILFTKKLRFATLRNYPVEDYPDLFPKRYCKFIIMIHFYFLNYLNIISCSKTINKKLKIHGKVSHTIKNSFSENSSDKKTGKKITREFLRIPDDANVYISVGSLIKRKNMETLVNAFMNCNSRSNYLIILGDGYLFDKIYGISKNSTNVLLLGHVHNVWEYLEICDFYISTSYSEGLPNSVLEALNYCLPCLLSDIPSHREIFSDINPRFVTFFNPNNTSEITDLINNNYLTRNVPEIKNFLFNNYSSLKMSLEYQKLYQNIYYEEFMNL